MAVERPIARLDGRTRAACAKRALFFEVFGIQVTPELSALVKTNKPPR